MTITTRLVIFALILAIEYPYRQPAKIGTKNPPPVKAEVLNTLVITLLAILGLGLFTLVQPFWQDQPATSLLPPSVWVAATLLLSWPVSFGLREICYFRQSLPQLLCLPALLNLALTQLAGFEALAPEFYYAYFVALGFFFLTALCFFGICQRLLLAPIPAILRGWPIKLLSLLLIQLSVFFFRGVFFGQLF